MDIIKDFKTLSLGKFQEIVKLKRDGGIDDVERHVGILSVLTGKDKAELLRLPLAQFRQLSADAAFLDKDIENAGRPAQLYRFGTFELEPTLAVSKMTAAQFIDFSTMTKDMQPEDLDGRLVGILSCFLVPKGKGYCEGYDVADVQAAIRDNMSVYDAAALIAFFLTSSARYVKDSLRFSEKMTKGIKDRKTRKEMQKKIAEAAALMKNGAGWRM